MTAPSAQPMHCSIASRWIAAALILCLMLFLGPYYGIRHDSVLYFGQSLLRWKPESLGQDLFFAYGSQAQFTLLPQFLALLMPHVPAWELFIALTVTGKLAFLAASFILIRRLLPPGYRYWGLLAVLVMPPIYGGYSIFAYLEPFTTGRTFADPLILLALAACFQKNWLLAIFIWISAAILHPLQALPALLVTWFYLIACDRRWLHLLWLAALPALPALIEPSISQTLFARFDPDWLTWSLRSTKDLFILHWRLEDWCRLLTDAFLVSLLLRDADERIARTALALLFSTLIAFLASILLVDILHLALPAGLQLWRVHWLLHWFAMATLPWQLARLYVAGNLERPRFLMLLGISVLGLLAVPIDSGVGTSGAVLILIPLFLLWPRLRDGMRPILIQVLMIAIVLGLALVYARFCLSFLHRFELLQGNREAMRPEFVLLSHPLAIGSLLTAALWGWYRGAFLARMTLVLFLAIAMLYAGLNWDRRSTVQRHLEAAQANPSIFGVDLPVGAQVLWADDGFIDPLLAPWMILERPSYFTSYQLAGVVFSRRMAEVAFEHEKVVNQFLVQQQNCNRMNFIVKSPDACVPSEALITDTCAAAKGQLTYIVMHNKLATKALGNWSVPAERKGDQQLDYYLYQCRDFTSHAVKIDSDTAGDRS